jgi:electron transfer flavoprotein alpha/beta subunit
MRIIVPLRRVLDPAGLVFHRRLGRIFVNREEYIIQPADHCALEAALRIKDATGAEVVALSGRPEPDDDTLKRGLSMGADRAIYLTGEGFKAADEAAMVNVLEETIRKLGGADLIIAGALTLDTGQSQMGLRLAEALGWPQLTDVLAVEVSDGEVQAVGQAGGEYVKLEADLPAVVTVAPGALEPRYPDGARLINVYRGEGEMAAALEAWNVAELVEPGTLAPLIEERGKDFPPERERGERVDGSPEEMAEVVAQALRQRLRG